MPDIDLNQFTVVQLKNWLNVLGLQTSGSKTELMTRLQTLSSEARGDPLNGASFSSQQPPETEIEGAASLPCLSTIRRSFCVVPDRRRNMDPLVHTRDQGTVETVDFTRRTCSEEGEDCPIGQKSDGHRFL